MRISIKVSDLMNTKSKYLGSLEDRVIRVPAELRDLCGMELGDFANLRSIKNEIISLRISRAYFKNAHNDPLSGYVTRNVFDGLHLKEIKMQHEQEIDIFEGITLGCDPELFIVAKGNGEIINAKRIFRKYGQVGSDGLMLEIRPLPSTDEWVVAHNIWTCLYRARKALNESRNIDGSKVMLLAASYYSGLAAGFHLHFGIPKELIGGGRNTRRWALRNQIARALDYYVGITSILPEGETDNVRRSAPHVTYGKPGEWRQEGVTFEYRVPGGYMLRHPVLTIGLLGLGAIVMEDALSRIRMCTDNFRKLEAINRTEDLQEIYPHVPDIFELYRTIACANIGPAKAYLDTILTDVSKMVGFEKRKKSIEKMFKCIYDGVEFSPYIEENWRLFYNEKQQRSVDVLSA